MKGVGKATRVTKRRAETRARLIEAAIPVFAEKGYGHVTIEDVCRTAGYTRGAFYSQFDSLEDLMFVLYSQWTAQIADKVRAELENGDTINDLPGIIARVAETLLSERHWLIIKVDLLATAARNPNLANRWSNHRRKLRMVIEERLTASGIELHESIRTPGETARAIVAIYDGLGIQLVLDRDEQAARSWLTQLLNLVLTPAPQRL